MHSQLTNHLAGRFLKSDDSLQVIVRASVEIQVPIDTVFNLITDLKRKTSLCPNTAVIDIAKYPPGDVKIGTVFHHRVAVDGHLADYNNQVVDYRDNAYMVTKSDSDPPFIIIVSVESVNGKTRLSQQESFPLRQLVMPIPHARGWLGAFFKYLFGDEESLRQDNDSLKEEIEIMQAKLQPRLEAWLSKIKQHLEKESKLFLA